MRKWKEQKRAIDPEYFKRHAQKFYAGHIEQARADRREYYKRNADRMNARVRANYHAHAVPRLVQIKEWKNANPEKVRKVCHQRRAWKYGAAGTASDVQIEARVAVFGGMCAYCARKPYEHLDHVVALSRGGTNWPANLRPACAECNLAKNFRTWPLPHFGWLVGGDCVSSTIDQWLLSCSNIQAFPKEAIERMEDREILYRDYREAIGVEGEESLGRFLVLARRYERHAVLRKRRICVDCGCELQYAPHGKDYCPNLCDAQESVA